MEQTSPTQDTSPKTVEGAEPEKEEVAASGESSASDEPEWWDDPRMPWGHPPTRNDLACFGAISVLGIYALALLPFRAVLVMRPFLAAILTGSRTGVVMIGALTAVGQVPWWPLWLVIATLSLVKFDWVYFWAGRLWGRGVFEMIAGKSARARRNAERAEKISIKYSVPALLLAKLPIPLPAAVIYATLGTAGMKWRKFFAWDIAFAALMQSLYFSLGYRIGEPAVEIVAAYGKYLWYVTLAILIGMIVTAVLRSQQKKRTDSTAPE